MLRILKELHSLKCLPVYRGPLGSILDIPANGKAKDYCCRLACIPMDVWMQQYPAQFSIDARPLSMTFGREERPAIQRMMTE